LIDVQSCVSNAQRVVVGLSGSLRAQWAHNLLRLNVPVCSK
jgi:hypothetical protein